MFNTIPGRLSVYGACLAFDLACWYGLLHLCGVI